MNIFKKKPKTTPLAISKPYMAQPEPEATSTQEEPQTVNAIQFPELPKGFWWAVEPTKNYSIYGSSSTYGYSLCIMSKRLLELSSGKRWFDTTCASVSIEDAAKVAHNEAVEGYNASTLATFRWKAGNEWIMRESAYPDDAWLDDCHLRTELLELTTKAILAHVPLVLEQFEADKAAEIARKEREVKAERAEAISKSFVGSYPPKVLP